MHNSWTKMRANSTSARRLGVAEALAHDLEQCVRATAATVADFSSVYTDHCLPPAEKTGLQAQKLQATLRDMRARHGYASALWCAFYAMPMPAWPYMDEWYHRLLCPWEQHRGYCGLGGPNLLGGDEIHGEPAPGGGEQQKYWAQLLTMSCGLCARLRGRLGPPPYTAGRPIRNRDAGGREWVNQWDLHSFGVWLAGDIQSWDGFDVPRVIELIYRYRVTNGEVLHGFVWQSLASLAPPADLVGWVAAACASSWNVDSTFAPRTEAKLECAHGQLPIFTLKV